MSGERLDDLGRDALAARLDELGTGRMSSSEARVALNELLSLAQELDRDEAGGKNGNSPEVAVKADEVTGR